LVGTITEAELQVLIDRLEEESETDQDYYIDLATIDMLGDGTATDHLLARGHREIGLINGLRTSLTARLREEGFREALQRAGITPVEARITHLGYRAADAGPALAQIMAEQDRPSAVVVANVNAAMGVLTTARELGLRVPEDLSVIAVHDAWTCDHTWPPLTTVRMPLYDLGVRAVRTLHDRLRGSVGVDSVVSTVAPLVVERSSVRSLS